MERRSADGEDFAKAISDLHEQVKLKLQDTNQKYKQRANLKRREVQFEVGYLVLAHLLKERLPKREYNKFKMKKIGPCRILQKFSANSYELQSPPSVGISPIFNVVDLSPYTTVDEEDSSERQTRDIQDEERS